MVPGSLWFFRVDDCRIEKMVSEFGEAVSFEDAMSVNAAALGFGLDYLPVCPCEEGSLEAIRLEANSSYVSKRFVYKEKSRLEPAPDLDCSE